MMPHKITEEQLTAYVLNELNKEEQKKVEKALEDDPKLMEESIKVREFCKTLKLELSELSLSELSASHRKAINNKLFENPVDPVNSVIEEYKRKFFWKWKIAIPAICVSVLALSIFLKIPDRISYKEKDYIQNKVVSKKDNGFMDRMASNYLMENASNNIYGPSLLNNNFMDRKRFYRTPKLINKETEPGYFPSRYYNLGNHDFAFMNKTRMSHNSSYVMPIKVNTESYNKVKQFLRNNQLPPRDAVRIEEMINYFDYNYSSSDDEIPFSVTTEVSKSPWNNKCKLMHIGFKGKLPKRRMSPEFEHDFVHTTTAKDVRIRLEFDPTKVKTFKLVGYENKGFSGKDIYHNCEMYADDLCVGQVSTVLYELMPNDETFNSNKIMTLKFGYKLPDKDQWRIFIYPVAEQYVQFDKASDSFRFSAAVAAFGMMLKDSDNMQDITYNEVINIAKSSKGLDKKGYRKEFINLVKTAMSLDRKK